MRREEIKKIMVVHNDNDSIKAFDWIGKVVLMTINLETNMCGGEILEESDDIEKFIHSLLPSAIEFIQYREDKYADYCRYRDVSRDEVLRLTNCFEKIRFKFNFDDSDDDWLFGGDETLIIDVEGNRSYIR